MLVINKNLGTVNILFNKKYTKAEIYLLIIFNHRNN